MLLKIAVPLLSLYCIALLCSMSAMEFLSWSLVAIFLTFLVQRKTNVRELAIHPWVERSLLVFFCVGVIGLLLNGTGEEQIKGVGSLRWIILLYVFSFWLQDSTRLKRCVQILMGFGTFTACYAIYQHFTGIDLNQILGLHKTSARMLAPFPGATVYQCMGFFGHHLKYGYSMILIFTVTLAFAFDFLKTRNFTKASLYVFAAGLMGQSLVWTYGRGVWVSALIGGLIVVMGFGKRFFLPTLLVTAVAVSTVFVLSPSLRARAVSVTQTDYTSNSDRRDLWKANWAMFLDHPVFGVGILRNEDLTAEYYQKLGIVNTFVGHAHNTYLNFLSMTGILGATAFIVFIFTFVWISYLTLRLRQISHFEHVVLIGILGGEIAFHVGGLTQCNFKDAVNNHLFIFLLAAVGALYRKSLVKTGARPLSSTND